MPQVPSTRWCPTAEQLVVLDELYRSGVRTPNASQIQQITAYLSSFGKIEGKNVFYWFQNHKARERQKLRRLSMLQQQLFCDYYSQFDYFDEASQHCLYHYITQPIGFSDQVNLQNGRQGMNLFSNSETSGSVQSKIAIHGHDWVKNHSISDTHPCFKPLKTLDLFPMKSTGFKDEQNLAQPQ